MDDFRLDRGLQVESPDSGGTRRSGLHTQKKGLEIREERLAYGEHLPHDGVPIIAPDT